MNYEYYNCISQNLIVYDIACIITSILDNITYGSWLDQLSEESNSSLYDGRPDSSILVSAVLVNEGFNIGILWIGLCFLCVAYTILTNVQNAKNKERTILKDNYDDQQEIIKQRKTKPTIVYSFVLQLPLHRLTLYFPSRVRVARFLP